jgi:hypothetical protein
MTSKVAPYPAASNGAALQPAHTGSGWRTQRGVDPLILGNEEVSFLKPSGVDQNSLGSVWMSIFSTLELNCTVIPNQQRN